MWNWKEIVDSLEREASIKDIQELYKAMIIYEVGLPLKEINEDIENEIDKIIAKFWKNDIYTSFLNSELIEEFDKNDKIIKKIENF